RCSPPSSRPAAPSKRWLSECWGSKAADSLWCSHRRPTTRASRRLRRSGGAPCGPDLWSLATWLSPDPRPFCVPRPSFFLLLCPAGRHRGNPDFSNRAMLEPRRDQRPGQGQPEHVIGHAETGIPVEDHGCWEDSEQAENQDPLAFSISASPLLARQEDRRDDDRGQRDAVHEIRRPDEQSQASIVRLGPRHAGDPQIGNVASDHGDLAPGVLFHAAQPLADEVRLLPREVRWKDIVVPTTGLDGNRTRDFDEARGIVARRYRIHRAVTLEEVRAAVLAHADEATGRVRVEREDRRDGKDQTEAGERCHARAEPLLLQPDKSCDGDAPHKLWTYRKRDAAGDPCEHPSHDGIPTGRLTRAQREPQHQQQEHDRGDLRHEEAPVRDEERPYRAERRGDTRGATRHQA